MNSARKGNSAELEYAKLLQTDGWAVGSRRHTKGPGDLIAIKWGRRPRIIEVKARANLWQGFRKEDRTALIAYAESHGADCYAAWRIRGVWKELWPKDWP